MFGIENIREIKMAKKNNRFSFEIDFIDFEEVNRILSENPQENQLSYERLVPIVQKRKEIFMAKMISRMRNKGILDTSSITIEKILTDYALNKGEVYSEDIENKTDYKEQVVDNSTTCSFFML